MKLTYDEDGIAELSIQIGCPETECNGKMKVDDYYTPFDNTPDMVVIPIICNICQYSTVLHVFINSMEKF